MLSYFITECVRARVVSAWQDGVKTLVAQQEASMEADCFLNKSAQYLHEVREASLFMGWGGGIREVSYGVANCALGYFGVLLLDP